MATHTTEYMRRYYRQRRLHLLSFFSSRCDICGEEDVDLLEFHHVNGVTMPSAIRIHRGGWGAIADVGEYIATGKKDEIRVLCKECHDKLHYGVLDGL
jgi:hypothetical protein